MDNSYSKAEVRILWKKLKGNITIEEDKILNEWLNADPKNKAYFDKLSQFYNNGVIPGKEVINTRNAWHTMEARINRKKKTSRQRKLLAVIGVAASILFLIGIFSINRNTQTGTVNEMAQIDPGTSKAVLILSNGEKINLGKKDSFSKNIEGAIIENDKTQLVYRSSNQKAEIINYNTLEIPRGAEFFVILSDGTRVWLNSETSLKYPVIFDESNRSVILKGEAYFEVAEDINRPFIVKTDNQNVEVLGTSFNVNTYSEKESIQTTLIEGKVKVFSEKDPENSVMLDPGQQAAYLPDQDQFTVHNVNVDEYISWKDGFFRFREKSLEEMMMTLSRWYDINVEFSDSSKATILFTGVVKRYEEFDKILQLLQKTEEVRFEIKDRNVTVK